MADAALCAPRALNRVGYMRVARETCRSFDFPNTTAGGLVDVVVTSYEVAIADSKELQRLRWGAVVVDEGHRLKISNRGCLGCCRRWTRRSMPPLTGTPLQNIPRGRRRSCTFSSRRSLRTHRPSPSRSPRMRRRYRRRARARARGETPRGGRPTTSRRRRRAAQEPARAARQAHASRLKRDVLGGLPKMRKAEVACQLSPFQREVYADVLARNHGSFNAGRSRQGADQPAQRAQGTAEGLQSPFSVRRPRRTPFGRRGRAASRRGCRGG